VRPRLLDLFCGAGGAAVGYARAGFDVVGVDVKPQPRYPFEFFESDALEYLRAFIETTYDHGSREIEAIHASPPCQAYSVANNIHGATHHPELISATRELLEGTGLPWVIENVEGARAYMREPYTLCGRSLGLGVKRHRLFETNFPLMVPPCHSKHAGDWVSVFGHTVLERGHVIGKAKGGGNRIKHRHLGVERGRVAMGIDWMTREELSEAIPPAMTELVGHQLLAHLRARSAA
jgi:DNA (cytosine-5)-methyltransferase 1